MSRNSAAGGSPPSSMTMPVTCRGPSGTSTRMPSRTRPAREGGSPYDSSSWPAIDGMTAIWTMGLVGLYLDSCYKNDMRFKNKALVLILLCLFLGSAAGACSSFVGQKSKSHVETAEDDGEEEVLD